MNFTSDLLDLLLSFRANKHVSLVDIRKAFLMFRLELEADKDRFCFFLKDRGRLRCFIISITFGFTSSSFIFCGSVPSGSLQTRDRDLVLCRQSGDDQ